MRSFSTDFSKKYKEIPKQKTKLYIDTKYKPLKQLNKSSSDIEIFNLKVKSANRTEKFVKYNLSRQQLSSKTTQFSNSGTQEIYNFTGNQNSIQNLNLITKSQLDFKAQKQKLQNNNNLKIANTASQITVGSQMKLSKTLINNNENISTNQSSLEFVELQKDFKITKNNKTSKFRASLDVEREKKTQIENDEETIQLPITTKVSKFFENQKKAEKSEIVISNTIKELEKDKLIQIDENLNHQAFESSNMLLSSQHLQSEIYVEQEKKTKIENEEELIQLPITTKVSKFLENQKQEEKKSEIVISNTIKELEKDKLIQVDENLNHQAFESSNMLSSSQHLQSEINLTQKEQTTKIYLNQQYSESQLSYCSLSKKLLSKQFFLDIPNADTPFQYYVHYLLYQTVRSSEMRNHFKKNFDQYQYLKSEILPNLSKLPEKIVDLPKPAHKQS